MARLRFPGRPGCRFDRMGVRYGADDAKNVNDPTLVLVASIHRGLRLFRELFGESDEEEDFEGFTPKDVQQSERKLKALLAQCESSPEKVLPSYKPIGKRLAKVKDTAASSDRGRGIRKSYTELLKHGIVKPSKISTVKQAREETQKSLKIKFKVRKERTSSESSRKSLDKKTVKFDFTPKGQGKRKSLEPSVKKTGTAKKGKNDSDNGKIPQYSKKKVKERDKLVSVQGSKGIKGQQNLAKQLLQKARKGQQSVKVPGKVKSPVTSPKSPRGPVHPKKQFILPTQSSRSSRVIIPNKRFLEQDDFNQIMTKRSRVDDSGLSPKPETFPATSPRVKVAEKSKVKDEHLKTPQLTSLSSGPTIPLPPGHLFDPMEAGQSSLSLYDQPLIVEGKRARKPSLKVRIKLTDERIQAFQVKSFEKKLQARKTIEAEKAAVQSVPESKKVHLTPSKLAGAVTSPSKLTTSPIFAPPKFGVSGQSALSERQRLEALEKEALATRRKGHNILRKAKLQLSRSALNRSKADFARTLKKEIKMEAKLEKMRLKQGSAVGGFSKVSGYSTFAGVAKSYMDAKDEQPYSGGQEDTEILGSTDEAVVCAVCKDPNLPPIRRRNYYGVPSCDGCRRFYRVHMKRAKEKEFFCNGNCKTDIRRCVFCRYLRCQEVFPSEDKLKPSKESPTKKMVPGESFEDTEGLMSPPKIVPVLGPAVDESEEAAPVSATSSPESVTSSPASEGRGPRIKHVCRKAAVVLGKPVAKFPQTPPQSSLEITLSALPRGEKVKLWRKEEETKAGLSDDERTLDEIIQQSEDNVCTVKKSPHKSPAFSRLIPGSRGRLTVRRRKLRCKKCPGCLAKDCGKCIYCQDKPKFGGRGVMKQACIERKCEFPRYSRAATAAFIKPKEPASVDDTDSCDRGCNTPVEECDPADPSQNPSGCSNPKNGSSSMNLIRRMVLQSQGNARPEVKHSRDSDPMIRTPANISRQLLPQFSGGVSRENLSQKSGRQSPLVPPFRTGDPSRKPGLGVLSPKKMPKGKDRNLTVLRSENCVLQPLPSTLRHWPQSGYRIKAEFKENYDIDKAWLSGVPLTMSGPLCVRTICYLCGSAGKYDFVFCNVCCEPFHEFCLEEDERPTEENRENWCCHRCQFCHVCGEQYNLLRCDKCQNTYHPECLGPNYPTKPSKKKKIWVCTKCVRCKSCGSTTPGNAGHATWTYDFQLCYECGKLMDKGNFCPMCHKCYSDDDWDSKMVQCVTCESWVHAKCEGLNDEMYERMSFLPEDVHYICKMCSPGDRPRHWELVLRDDLQAGIKSVFYTLLNAKCAQHLLHIEAKMEPGEEEVVSKGGSCVAGIADKGGSKGSLQTDGVKDSDRTANNENKQSVDEESNDTTAEKESLNPCNTEKVAMETDTVDVVLVTNSNCNSNSSHEAMQRDLGGWKGSGVGEHVGSGVTESEGLGSQANCDSRNNVSEKIVPCSADESDDNDVSMEIDEPCVADGKATEHASSGGCDIKVTATVTDSQIINTDVTDFKTDIVRGSANDGKASQNESAGGSINDRTATENELKTQGSSSELKDEVDGGQGSDQTVVQGHFHSNHMSESCDSSKTIVDQSVVETSKSIDQSDVISITDDNQTDSIPQTTDQSNSLIQDCKVESDQSDSSLLLKSTQAEDISKVGFKTDDRKSETISNIDNNNSLDLKCETSVKNSVNCETANTEGAKCETSQTEAETTKCEISEKEDKKCEISPAEGIKCDTCLIEDSKCDKSPIEGVKCESPQTEDSKFESPQKDDTKDEESEIKSDTPEKLTGRLDVALVTPKKSGSSTSVHVRFSDKSGLFRQVVPTRDFPQDFSAVKVKMASDKYNSVEEFSEDMAHIISLALNDTIDQRIVRKKNNNSVRSMFVKQMERCFPWFNIKTCKLWDHHQNLPGGMLPEAVIPPSEDHTYAQWLERQETPKSPQPSPFKKLHSTPIPKALPIAVDEDAEKVLSCDLEDAGEDMRRCILCWHYGDADPNDAGRLLYSGQDDWIHINCALWSAEAYEEELDGSLQNVHAAVSRGKHLKCDHCNRSGATVGCCTRGCPANYHFMCARQSRCVFQEDKKVFCSQHRDKVDNELVAKDHFAVNRRVLVDLEGIKWAKKTWAKGLDPAVINVLIGSCTVESLGRLTPSSDYTDCLAPADFVSSRVFWSTRDARRRCVYTCRIVEVKPESPKSVKVVLKDVTIIHDESHPDYVPLSTLDIPGVNLFPDMESLNNNNNNSFKSDIIDLSGESCDFETSANYQPSSVHGLSSNYNGSSSIVTSSQSDNLSSSWPLVKKKKVDLSVLSPKTLKLLNIKDPEKYKKSVEPEKPPVKPAATPSVVTENNFSGFLTKIADRLNQAAARNIGQKDGNKTPPLARKPGRARSSSVDRMTTSRSNSVERFVPSPLSHVRSKSVERSMTSPLSRSRSNSTEREYLASSPGVLVGSSNDLNNDKEIPRTKDSESDGNTTFSTVSAEESMDQSGLTIDSSLEPIVEEGSQENIQETVIVLPEDCGELTEEEVLAIAQAALEQNESMEVQEEESGCEEKLDTLQKNLEEGQAESNFDEQTDCQKMETNDDIMEGETTTKNSEEEMQTSSDPLRQTNKSSSDDSRETTTDQFAEVSYDQQEITTIDSDELRETSPSLQGESTTDHSIGEREKSMDIQCDTKQSNDEIQENSVNKLGVTSELPSDDMKETLLDHSDVKMNVSDPPDNSLQTVKKCMAVDSETNVPSGSVDSNDQREIPRVDLTSDSSDELEADLDNVILIDINKGCEEEEGSVNTGQELDIYKENEEEEGMVNIGQESDINKEGEVEGSVNTGKELVDWNEDLYLCSTSGQFKPKQLPELPVNQDIQERVLHKSNSNDCVTESATTEDQDKSVANKHLTEELQAESSSESASENDLAESVSDKSLMPGLTEKQDQICTDEDASVSSSCHTTSPAMGDSNVNNGQSSVTSTSDGILSADQDGTYSQQTEDRCDLSNENRLLVDNKTKSDVEKESLNNDGFMAIDLTGDDMEGDTEDTSRPVTEQGKGSIEKVDIISVTVLDLSDTTEKEDVQKVVRPKSSEKEENMQEVAGQESSEKEDLQKVVRREPLHFLRPIEMEEEPVLERKYRKKSPSGKSKYFKDKKDGQQGDIKDRDVLNACLFTSKDKEKTDTNNKNSEQTTVENTIHLNILTKSMGPQSCSKDEDGRNLRILESQARENIDLSHRTTEGSQVLEPIYNARNELIGHRIVANSNSQSEASSEEKRISPTSDLCDMVVRELVSENHGNFQSVKSDFSQSEECTPQDPGALDNLSSNEKMLVDPDITKGDNFVKDQTEANIPETSIETAKADKEDQMSDNEMDETAVAKDQLLDSNTQNASAITTTPVKLKTEEEKRLEKEKTEILKGLGLARTPTGNEEIFSPDSNSKSTPLKKYPLRHRRSNSGHSDDSPVKSEMDWLSEQKLPIHEEIAQKIKAESLAKSIPGAKGPFKCPTCKRLYRTRESFKTHVKSCDFEVSTSDEEEEEEEEEKVKDGRRRYSVREHTMDARKAMEGEMRARVVLQNRETSPTKKRGRPKRPLHDDTKESSNHTGSPLTDDGTPPVKRGRGRPRLSLEVVPDKQSKIGVTKTPEECSTKGKRGRLPKLKSPVSEKSPVQASSIVQNTSPVALIRKRGRLLLNSPKGKPEEESVTKTGIKRSPLKSLSPKKPDIVRKRGRPSLKFSPKKVLEEELPQKRERLSGGGLKYPPHRSPSLMGSPRGRGQVGSPRGKGQAMSPRGRGQARSPRGRGQVDTPRGRGRPPKINSPSVKIECEEDVSPEKTEEQKTAVQTGEISPTKRRGRPPKIPKSPEHIDNKLVKDRLSIFEIFNSVEGSAKKVNSSEETEKDSNSSPDTKESVKSPEVKRKRGRPPKNKKVQKKDPEKSSEDNKPLEGGILSSEVRGRKSDLKVKDGVYTESGRPSRRTASLALQKFEDNLGTDTDDTLDTDGNSTAGSDEFKEGNSDEVGTQKVNNEDNDDDDDTPASSRKKQNFSKLTGSTQDQEEKKGNNSKVDNNKALEGSSAMSAIVIDSENEEESFQTGETKTINKRLSNKVSIRIYGSSSQRSSSLTTDTKDDSIKEESSTEDGENTSATTLNPEAGNKKVCGTELAKDQQQSPIEALDSVKSVVSSSSGGKMMTASSVQTEDSDDQQEPESNVPSWWGNTSLESNVRAGSSESSAKAGNTSNTRIGENMVHPTTPLSIRGLLQQKMAIAPKEKPSSLMTIKRQKSADSFKEDIRSILPVLPANIVEQLRDPKQRIAAMTLINDLISVKSASDSAKSMSQPKMETKTVEDVSPIQKFTLPRTVNTREAIQNYVRSHIGQRNKEVIEESPQQSNILPCQQETPEPSYQIVSPSDPRLLSPAAVATGFQVMSPTNNLAGSMVQVAGGLSYQLSQPQPVAQLTPRIPIATNRTNQLPQLAPQLQVHTPRVSISPLLQPKVSPQILGTMANIQQLQNLQSTQLPPFNISPSPVSVTQQTFTPFSIGSSAQPVLGMTSTPTPIGQRTVFVGPPVGTLPNIPQVSGITQQERVSRLPGTALIPQEVSPQMYGTPAMVNNTHQGSNPIMTGNSNPVLHGQAAEKKNPNTLVRIFVDGKPVAVTTDPSVLNNHDKLLSRLGSTNLQAGTYSITVTTHKMSLSTNTLTMAGQSSTPSPVPLAPKTDNRVLQSLLKAPPASGLGPSTMFPTVTTSTQATSVMSTGSTTTGHNSSAVKKFLTKKEMMTVSGMNPYVRSSDGKMRRPMIKPNIIHKKRASGKKMLVTMEKNGMIQGSIAKAVMRKFVRNNIEVSPKKKIVFRGLTSSEGNKSGVLENLEAISSATSEAPGTSTSKLPGSVAASPRIRKLAHIGKIKVSAIPNTGKIKVSAIANTGKAKVNAIKKGIRRRKTPLKARNVALPHVTGVMSHPILHAQKELLTLPQPAVEEEVIATPYSRANDSHTRLQSRDGARSKNEPFLSFEISSDDGFTCKADSMDEAWRQVAEKVQDARVAARMKQLSFQSMNGVTMFGVNHNSLRYLIEQLYGMQHFRNYQTLYHHYDLSPEEEEPAENPTGCIRTEGYHGRKPFDMFSFLMSTYRRKPDPIQVGKSDVEMTLKSQRRATSMDLPMAMRFRKLKEHSREAVGVYRSPIHGRGLFCKRNIDGGEMIIEYAGEVIRSSLTDKREKYYESKGIGCYMFRIDDMDVVDATMRGSAARFINHSCEPNCYSKVIQVDGKKHIVIFASRAIKRGEELTYDYKFPIEEVKIPCTCGQKRCRKYLN
ncbi:uncharacterized protein [Argopecten irradians]|uniref:uncharacterized protein n=1 Tax=Argopecten irradians TaxID=31199 RepID=UPI003722072F